MRRLIWVVLLLPLLCWGIDIPFITGSTGFGYSYEEEERRTGDCDSGDNCDLRFPTVGIFKVYLDCEVDLDLWCKLERFEHNGLKFTWVRTDSFGDNGEHIWAEIWVENVRELPDRSVFQGMPTFYGKTPTHAEAWDVRCLAIDEIERLKRGCDHICHIWSVKVIGIDGVYTQSWRYCPYCGEKLK